MSQAANDMRRYVVGHRGAGNLAPENTLAAFAHAAQLGLRYIEVDVQMTKDGVLILSHDNDLSRCGRVPVKIAETSYLDICKVNVAAGFGAATDVMRAPTLAEALSAFQAMGLVPQIELKPQPGCDQQMVEGVVRLIESAYRDAPETDRPLITSDSPDILQRFNLESDRRYKTGLLVARELTEKWNALANAASCDYVHINGALLTGPLAQAIKDAGYGINGWHINDPDQALQFIAAGSTRFTSDIPDKLMQLKCAR